MTVSERDAARGRLQLLDNLTNYPTNPRFDDSRHNQLITTMK